MRAAAARCPERFLFKTAVGPKAAETSRTAVPVKIRPTALCELRGRHTANGGTDQPHAPTANAAGKWHQRAGLTKLRLPLTGKVTRSLSGAGPGHRHKCRDVLCGQLFELTESRSRVLPLPRALALQHVSIGTQSKIAPSSFTCSVHSTGPTLQVRGAAAVPLSLCAQTEANSAIHSTNVIKPAFMHVPVLRCPNHSLAKPACRDLPSELPSAGIPVAEKSGGTPTDASSCNPCPLMPAFNQLPASCTR